MTNDSAKHFNVIANTDDQTAVNLLAEASELSKQVIKNAMQKGAVWLTTQHGTQRLRRAKRILKTNDSLDLYYNTDVLAQQPIPAVLIEDLGDYSVWFKPRGMLSQGSKWSDHTTLQRWAEQHLEPLRTAFPVHRLDRATCGVMLLAHNKKTAQELSRMFEKREVEKTYRAWVNGEFSQEKQTYDDEIDNRRALTHASLLDFNEVRKRSLLNVQIETGRKHQIRRHLANAGYDVIGDRLYGDDATTEEDLALAATRISFSCPKTKYKKHFVLSNELIENYCPELAYDEPDNDETDIAIETIETDTPAKEETTEAAPVTNVWLKNK